MWYSICIFTKGNTVLPGNVLKVGSFLNQQMDSDFIMEIGKEIARLYEGTNVTRILTIESSGIALAVAAGIAMHVPTVFAKKHKSANMPKSVYTAPVYSFTYSFTHHETYEIAVAREYLPAGEKVLIVDDFLANGNAVRGLMHIIKEAGAELVGCAIAIEKGFQEAGDQLRKEGVRIDSLAIIDAMTDESVTNF